MTDAILVLNAGSSSIKYSLFARGEADLALVDRGQVEGLSAGAKGASPGHQEALAGIVDRVRARHGAQHRLAAVGHRVVHGGPELAAPVRIDAALLARLEALVPLAPLHQPHNLAPIRLLLERSPALPQVACFDTAMHRSQPPLEQMYALPPELEAAGVRRYGFHGLSYEYIASVLPEVDPRAARGKTIVLHLGNGASLCALEAGRSIASTMGFSTLDGVPMGTRAGALDPGILLYLMDERGMDARAIEELLYKKSGLLGVSGLSSDMRVLLESTAPRAVLAVELFVHRIGRELGSLAAALGGLDAIVFTAGIGEHAAPIREQVCRRAAWLGVELDQVANAAHGPRISTPASRVAAWVLPTNEELMIARHTRDLVGS
jgi:acetate kinase